MAGKLIAANAAGKIAENKATPYIIGGVVLVTLGVAYFGVIRPILATLGVVSGADDKMERKLSDMPAFNPNYGNPSKTTMTHQQAKNLAEQLYNSISWYNDNEERIYNVIQQAGSTHNLSLVSRMFSAKYAESLLTYLTEALDADEMKKVEILIKQYPN